MSGHTPGPWYLATGCSWRRFLSEHPQHRDDPVCVPTTHPIDGWPDLIVSREDAALIASAPDLLAALEEAIEELQRYCEADSGEDYNNPRFNAAIAKAKGRLPDAE